MSDSGEERRRSPRAPLRVPIRLTKRAKEGGPSVEIDVVSDNISLHGAYFLVDAAADLSPGETVEAKVVLSTDPLCERFFQNLTGTAKVIRVEPQSDSDSSAQPRLNAVAIDFCRPLGFHPRILRGRTRWRPDIESLVGFKDELEKVRRLGEQAQALQEEASGVASRCQALRHSIENGPAVGARSAPLSLTREEILKALDECAALVTNIQSEVSKFSCLLGREAEAAPSSAPAPGPAEGPETDATEVSTADEALRESEFDSLQEVLCACGAASEKDLSKAMTLHQESGRYVGAALIDLGVVSEQDFLASTALRAGVPYVPLRHYAIDDRALRRVPRRIAEKYAVLPFDLLNDSVLLVAMANPANESARRLVSDLNPDVKVKFVASSVSELLEKLDATTASWPVASA